MRENAPSRLRPHFMKRLLHPLVLAVTAVLALGYAYVAHRLAEGPWERSALAIPFALVWIVPVVYWSRPQNGDRQETWFDTAAHQASYLAMAWLSFIFVFTLARDAALFLTAAARFTAAHEVLAHHGISSVLTASLIALVAGAFTALRGPRVKEVLIHIPGLHADLEGLRIAQISDLHVGPNIRRGYVERVVSRVQGLAPDLVALTGDIVDGSVPSLQSEVAPLAVLAADGRAFFVLGNHDCYSGAPEWIAHFRGMGMNVLLNENMAVRKGEARLVIGGVVDPAYRGARPDISLADAAKADFRLLLAHNPRLAPLGARAGYDLQLSGHTHAGQFFPWTIAVRLVHAPHVAGLSREGAMQVYVSAGTGTWGPPVRLGMGTSPEISLIKLTGTESR